MPHRKASGTEEPVVVATRQGNEGMAGGKGVEVSNATRTGTVAQQMGENSTVIAAKSEVGHVAGRQARLQGQPGGTELVASGQQVWAVQAHVVERRHHETDGDVGQHADPERVASLGLVAGDNERVQPGKAQRLIQVFKPNGVNASGKQSHSLSLALRAPRRAPLPAAAAPQAREEDERGKGLPQPAATGTGAKDASRDSASGGSGSGGIATISASLERDWA